jgi:hypothetical protein
MINASFLPPSAADRLSRLYPELQGNGRAITKSSESPREKGWVSENFYTPETPRLGASSFVLFLKRWVLEHRDIPRFS